MAFLYMTFIFRYRRLSALSTLAVGSAYYVAFENVNNILYKLLVDRVVIREAREQGLGRHVQPVGTQVPRSFNYN